MRKLFQNPLESQRQPSSEDEATRQQKKRVRVSKKEIPEYRWTEEAELRLAELVKENPQLYDKKQKEWLNVAAKNSRWDRVGEQWSLLPLVPNARSTTRI
ncbi:hypothetical protein HOLleu_41445 [Holothuria leucospilota]|uniref:Uncharacterized protein n=1 Tax=Holothuria leucospilota TaxID=206669 RepID=A0A9Q0YE71_HOLLE|nr:hypothetical protein HOLleu_41445 [Holothuria leucospilota]